MRRLLTSVALATLSMLVAAAPEPAAIDAEVRRAMAADRINGLAVAVVEDGRIHHVAAFGRRNAAGDPLQDDTVMYGASLTKAAFAYMVLQLVDEGVLDLDASIARYLPEPLPSYAHDRRYGPWHHLAGDERWQDLTPRILLSHRGGFANFAFVEPDGRLRIHFDPGTRYAYSGEGMILLQFVLEKGLGLDVGREMQRRVFDRFGMKTTSMMWRADFAANLADGFDADGKAVPHDQRSKVRAAGSMDTTIADMARLAAGVARGEGLGNAARAELWRPQWPITSASQFPSFAPDPPPERRVPGLAAGLGHVMFDGPQGRGFFKGGHNDSTGNMWVCIERRRSCIVLLSNDVRAERLYPGLVRFVLGEAGVPWRWEYGHEPWTEAAPR